MSFSFSEYLIISLIALLFADKYLPAILNKWFGIKIKGNINFEEQRSTNRLAENRHDNQAYTSDKITILLENHEKRLEVSNKEMGIVKDRLGNIEVGQARMEGKLDTLIGFKK